MCEHGNQIAVELPEFLATDDKNTVSIDSCIVDQIKALWEARIVTMGCCCGHGEGECSVILETSNKPYDVAIAYDILEKDRKRRWHILQWKLVSVAEKPAKPNRRD